MACAPYSHYFEPDPPTPNWRDRTWTCRHCGEVRNGITGKEVTT